MAEDATYDRLFDAVEKTLKKWAPAAQEVEDDAFIRQVCKSLRKGAKSSVFEQRPFHENIFQFCNKAFESLFAGMSNHKMLHGVDFLGAIDIAVKEIFPTDYLLRIGIDEYQSELEWACDAAFEMQRFEYLTWDILPQFFEEKKRWKRISTILDQARLKALLHHELPFGDRCSSWLEKYTSTWMNYVVSEWKELAKNYTLNAPTKSEVVAIFFELIQMGGLPLQMQRAHGTPSKAVIAEMAGWILDIKEAPEPLVGKVKTEVAIRPEGGLRQRARGRREGYGKGAALGSPTLAAPGSPSLPAPGSPSLSRTLCSPPPERILGSPPPPSRSIARGFPVRSPSHSPRRGVRRQHHDVDDAAEMQHYRLQEHRQARQPGVFSAAQPVLPDSSSVRRHHSLAAGGRCLRMKEELCDNLEESGDDGDDFFATRNAGDVSGNQDQPRSVGIAHHEASGHGNVGTVDGSHWSGHHETWEPGGWSRLLLDMWGNPQEDYDQQGTAKRRRIEP